MDAYLVPLTMINLKWIKDLNIKAVTIKLLKENVGKKASNCDFANNFLGITKKAHTHKIRQMDYIKVKSFCTAK